MQTESGSSLQRATGRRPPAAGKPIVRRDLSRGAGNGEASWQLDPNKALPARLQIFNHGTCRAQQERSKVNPDKGAVRAHVEMSRCLCPWGQRWERGAKPQCWQQGAEPCREGREQDVLSTGGCAQSFPRSEMAGAQRCSVTC